MVVVEVVIAKVTFSWLFGYKQVGKAQFCYNHLNYDHLTVVPRPALTFALGGAGQGRGLYQ